MIGCAVMIDYSPFWETLKNSNENWYTLTNKYHMSHSVLHRLKHSQGCFHNYICRILNCTISDVIKYVTSDKNQPL